MLNFKKIKYRDYEYFADPSNVCNLVLYELGRLPLRYSPDSYFEALEDEYYGRTEDVAF
jgi:hypothetical protein